MSSPNLAFDQVSHLDPMQSKRRSRSRARLGIPGRLEVHAGVLSCLIEDLSIGGARLRLGSPLKIGQPGVLQIEGMEVFGEIVWTHDSRHGFMFDEAISDSEVVALRHRTGEILQREASGVERFARAWVDGTA